MSNLDLLMQNLLKTSRLSELHNMLILTDPVEYAQVDQVFPIYPEQSFFLDELVNPKVKGANVLEIGLGSGVLSIGALKAGAKHVTALEINPRAKLFAGFSAVLNNVNHGLHILEGNTDDIWKPLNAQTFDYIMSNPPFMPTIQDEKHYFHSGGGGILGLDFVEKIFQQLDVHLTQNGLAQIVTAAPGDSHFPTTLLSLVETYLSGVTTVTIDPLALPFNILTHHLPEGCSQSKIKEITQKLESQGISHQYLCVIHYIKGEKSITTKLSKPHPSWDMPQ